ncbi:hypothetical protein [Streptomyces sp. NPDC053427]|uniref:hypothetical protein n=1 Tax=Streptomyces sp. NPDC053427 TaxID=3365701 RepID=UPI0037D79B7E
MSDDSGSARRRNVSHQDPLAVPRSGLADPSCCPGCALLKEQLREVLRTQNGLALWEVLDHMTRHKEYGHPGGPPPPR